MMHEISVSERAIEQIDRVAKDAELSDIVIERWDEVVAEILLEILEDPGWLLDPTVFEPEVVELNQELLTALNQDPIEKLSDLPETGIHVNAFVIRFMEIFSKKFDTPYVYRGGSMEDLENGIRGSFTFFFDEASDKVYNSYVGERKDPCLIAVPISEFVEYFKQNPSMNLYAEQGLDGIFSASLEMYLPIIPEGVMVYLPEKIESIQREPLEVLEGVEFSESDDIYTKPFATQEETMGLLSGSEGWTLCSQGETMYSRGFVQCWAALIKNRETGMISLIHQSTWSEAAGAVLMLQRREDLDVILVSGPFGSVQFDTVEYFHEKDPSDAIAGVEQVDLESSRKYRPDLGENRTHLMTGSALLGLTEPQVQEMVSGVASDGSVGETNLVGKIEIPLSKGEVNRWHLLYRPNENFIWIYESKSKKLFKYAGFDPV